MKRYFIIFTSFLATYLVCVFLRGDYVSLFGLHGEYQSAYIGYFLYLILTLFLLKKSEGRSDSLQTFLAATLGVCIFEIPVRLILPEDTGALLGSFLSWWLGILTAYAIFAVKNISLRILIAALSIALASWVAYVGYPMWIDFRLGDRASIGKVINQETEPIALPEDTAKSDILIQE